MTGQTFVLSRDRVIFWVRFSSVVQKRLDVEHVEVGEIMGAFHSTKNSGLKFRKFPVANGTVNREIFRLVTPARWDRIVPFSFGKKLPEIYDRKVLQGELFPMEQ